MCRICFRSYRDLLPAAHPCNPLPSLISTVTRLPNPVLHVMSSDKPISVFFFIFKNNGKKQLERKIFIFLEEKNTSFLLPSFAQELSVIMFVESVLLTPLLYNGSESSFVL